MPLYEVSGSHPCANCPTITSFHERSDSLDSMSIELMKQTTDPDIVDKIVTIAHEQVGVPEDEMRTALESNKTEIIGMMNGGLAAMDGERSRIDEMAEGITRDCPGPLRMRATDKLGRTVTATICSSPLIITGEHTELIGINRVPSKDS